MSKLELDSLKRFATREDLQALPPQKFRIQPSRKLLKKVLPLKNQLKITRIADLTDFDQLGLSVVNVTRPDVNSSQITATQGKGMTLSDSICSALMEAIERSAGSATRTDLITRSVNQMIQEKGRFVSPQELGARSHDPIHPIDWIEGNCLMTGKRLWLPAAEVLFPFYPTPQAIRSVRPSTTGLSAGSTLLEAILHSLFEVIERDRVSQFFRNEIKAQLLNIHSVSDPINRSIFRRFMNAGLDLLVCDLTMNSVVPVFHVIAMNRNLLGPPVTIAGQGAHLDPNIALRRALLETAQSRIVALQGSREDLIRHASDYQVSWETVSKSFYALKERLELNAYSQLCSREHEEKSIFEYLTELISLLDEKGFDRIYFTELTENKTKIPVVHSIIMGMVDQIVEPARVRLRAFHNAEKGTL